MHELQYAGTSWHELKFIRQAVGFLVRYSVSVGIRLFKLWQVFPHLTFYCLVELNQVIHQKRKKSLEEIKQDLCPVKLSFLPQFFPILFMVMKKMTGTRAFFFFLCDIEQALTVRQIYRISTMYSDDKYGTQSVSNEVSFYFHPCIYIFLVTVLFSSYLRQFRLTGCRSDERDCRQG